MPSTPTVNAQTYAICLKGQLDAHWVAWFHGMAITLDANGNTRLCGPVADQAALYGLIKRVRDVGLPLLSVHAVAPESEEVQES